MLDMHFFVGVNGVIAAYSAAMRSEKPRERIRYLGNRAVAFRFAISFFGDYNGVAVFTLHNVAVCVLLHLIDLCAVKRHAEIHLFAERVKRHRVDKIVCPVVLQKRVFAGFCLGHEIAVLGERGLPHVFDIVAKLVLSCKRDSVRFRRGHGD